MNNYKLYIDNKEIDFQDSVVSILFQKQRTDYTNPTIVKNSFTKTITLPGTKTNNSVFNEIWKLDRVQWSRSFNASKRTGFVLMKDGSLIEKGYVKLNNIVWDGQFYSYEVTLFGELGNILYGLSYKTDADDNVTPMTLGDLDFGFNGFGINIYIVEDCWKRLRGEQSQSTLGDTINFAVTYDGVPGAKNFDPQKMCCSVNRTAGVSWREVTNHSSIYYGFNDFPGRHFPGSGDSFTPIVVDGENYGPLNTGVSRMDPVDFYGLMELKEGISTVQARDFRSYLLRPVVRISKIFDAIGSYISTNMGYTLDLTDPFFSTEEFTGTWMTLSMLYEVLPEVETGSIITKQVLFSNTSSPASYLISYCKVYGIYLDVDYINKTLKLTRLPRFFNDKISEMKINQDSQIRITPLSFDKASYTFDYGEGEGEFLDKYKNTYGIQYGSKKVNTGYRFDASTSPYIDNNIFREGVDALEQSVYFRYPYAVRGGQLVEWPSPLSDENGVTYKLFHYTPQGTGYAIDSANTVDAQMKLLTIQTINNVGYSIANAGYQFMDERWVGLAPLIWQDGFAKTQLHSEGNGSSDGKDILLRFDGFRQTKYGSIQKGLFIQKYNRESYNQGAIDAQYVNYLLSDDNVSVKNILGVNCYYDCPIPDVSLYGDDYIKVVNNIPSFTRCSYTYEVDEDYYPVLYINRFQQTSTGSTSAVQHLMKYDNNIEVVVESSTGRQYMYFDITGRLKNNHKYFLAVGLRTTEGESSRIIRDNAYAHPDLLGGTVMNYKNLTVDGNAQFIGSIINSGSSGTQISSFIPISTYDLQSTVEWTLYYAVIIDLTEFGLENINTVTEAQSYFGFTGVKTGYLYDCTETLDFGLSREVYVPSCIYEKNIGIYDRYWGRYISDVYSVNTRVLEGECFIDNINDVFREFFYYDNSLWILSKVVDWNLDTKLCKGTFIKVNDKQNYLNT